ncbi:hypothetical protein [Nocardiopsis sp. SBT366]|uniref:hypothetical protein n=1 Tax=Nocardiopsis sp. SBT366 TaxID=1580529 RepID=UPI000AC70D5A|nr:hypothetical protein [Nocardiopsis sp. SBT366]
MVFAPPEQVRRLLDPGLRNEWDVTLTHGVTPEQRPVLDLTLTHDVFGIRTRWSHVPHGLEWTTSAVRVPGAEWTRTRLNQAVRLASQRPAVHHLIREHQRCALCLWVHRESWHLFLTAGPWGTAVRQIHPDREAGRAAAIDLFTHLIAHGWRPAPVSTFDPRYTRF